ncbi:uncharacterized protein AMSG_12105 [Thecamonas trahens ATCC 50062]|uniref:Peptidase S8/S53 domain-containing protein n=1 Tax=Thecamonas trahens ATCC 50062 TaxID=461836 RepID=A0A0L0DHJ6_THETB|nr:hypothetical protein AMSG_12105 [Thecamonas trahens ATCC 50062]KNC51787.1 hypothetical protein AMSG_12105 [Thecamonas trahens ATCC 50062]|eukprot:XP_013755763.1 hypothetical protein AMSG_12105 [Thecamonas trahens ATCC 50062]
MPDTLTRLVVAAVAALALVAVLTAPTHAAPFREYSPYTEEELTRRFIESEAYAHTDGNAHPHTLALHSHLVDLETTPDVVGVRRSDGAGHQLAASVRAWVDPSVKAGLSQERSLHVVHVSGRLDDDAKAKLVGEMAALGVSLGSYLPHHSYLVFCSGREALEIQGLPVVRWVGPFLPEYKVHAEVATFVSLPGDVQTTLSASKAPAEMPRGGYSKHMHGSKLFVLLAEGAPEAASSTAAGDYAAAVEARLEAAGFRGVNVAAASPSKLVVTLQSFVEQGLVQALARDAAVQHIEFAPVFALRNKFARGITQSGTAGQTPITAAGLDGAGEVVGVADSGLDYDNCMFYDSSVSQPGPSHRKIIAYEVAPGNDMTDDVNGHGTHVVGSVAGATASSSSPVADWAGQAPAAKVYFTDIGETGGGLAVPGDLNTGLFPNPYASGARIHSNSWGSSSPSYTSSAAEVDRFMNTNQDMLVLVAGGNDGGSPESITSNVGSPATSKSCLAVGASQTSNDGFVDALNYYDWDERDAVARDAGISDCCTANKAAQEYCCRSKIESSIRNSPSRWDKVNVAPFSSRGPTTDGRLKPDLMAPGQDIVSAHSDGGGNSAEHCATGSPSGANQAALLSMAGTSMACPTMAGLAALVRQYYLSGYYPSGSASASAQLMPSAALVKATLINSAVPLTGEIDVGNNGTYVRLTSIPSIFQGFGRVQLDNALKFASSSHALYVDDSMQVSTDATVNYCISGVTNAQSLKATLVWSDVPGSPSSSIALVNDLNLYMGTDEKTQTGNWVTKRDTRNTVEQAVLAPSSIISGTTYKVQVKGWNVPSGPQNYALVITGAFGSVSKTGCTYEFVDNFEEQGDAESFPLGVAVGVGAVGLVGGLIVMCSLIIFKDKDTLGKLLAAFGFAPRQ